MLPEVLKSERLQMEKISLEWLEEIFTAKTGNVAQYSLQFANVNEVHTWINDCRETFDRGQSLTMAVLKADTREFLGVAAINNLNIAPQFSLWIKESAQGNGYGKESVKILLDWFKENYGSAEKISYLVEVCNLVSLRLALSIGMQIAGEKINEAGKVFQELVI
jgi:RimJ/RimL family protein N-acetyltransferase